MPTFNFSNVHCGDGQIQHNGRNFGVHRTFYNGVLVSVTDEQGNPMPHDTPAGNSPGDHTSNYSNIRVGAGSRTIFGDTYGVVTNNTGFVSNPRPHHNDRPAGPPPAQTTRPQPQPAAPATTPAPVPRPTPSTPAASQTPAPKPAVSAPLATTRPPPPAAFLAPEVKCNICHKAMPRSDKAQARHKARCEAEQAQAKKTPSKSPAGKVQSGRVEKSKPKTPAKKTTKKSRSVDSDDDLNDFL
ncbi:hypothetical protein Slin15195_G049400 [Septoria linicola]|uniref:Uncharacterized protein n=1 Tax=Septoria linicola TaxID=215465 RepID=A0A9Q9ATF0_9PEZI|nr:hypothetical protein Slin15195_G049400 [Septoria linicola]